MSLADRDKPSGLDAARGFAEAGFRLAATAGTAAYLEDNGLPVGVVAGKVGEDDDRPDAVALMAAGEIQLVVNTPRGRGPRADGAYIRQAAAFHKVPCLTTAAAARAAAAGIVDWAKHPLRVRSLQEFHEDDQLALDL